MASALFNKARQKLLDALLDLNDGDIRAMLVRSTYAYVATHEFVADLGAVDNGRSASLANTTVTDGVFDADDSSLVATAAVASNAIVLFVHTGVDATASLVAYIDTGTGLPFTPAAGQTVTLQWDAGASRIFRIT